MKKRIAGVVVIALAGLCLLAQDKAQAKSDPAKIAGEWTLSMDTPHGNVEGPLQLKQDGATVTGTMEAGHFGTLPVKGVVDGNKIELALEIAEAEITFKLSGTVDGNAMNGTTEMGGAWKAARKSIALLAQQKSIVGTVTEFRVETLQLALKPDTGATQLFPIGPDTEVMRIPPGETTLEHAKPSALVDIAIGDRVLVSFVEGLAEARRIVVVAAGDIARRNEAERLDWQSRGVTGVVKSKNGDEVTIDLRTAQAGRTAVIAATAETKVRRYAPGSVKFTAALPSAVSEISAGDQIQARGEKSADGSRITAEDIVFGTFLTKMGSITAVSPEAHQIQIAEAADGRAWTIRITPESQLKALPDLRAMFAVASSGGHGDAAPHTGTEPPDIAQMLRSLSPARFDDLKVGGGVMLTSTALTSADNAKIGELTAIMLLTNADFLVKMSKPAANGQTNAPMDAFVRMHGGMLGGSGSFSLPAIIP
jgi:hypothetical protein